jgi:hypothetical protein
VTFTPQRAFLAIPCRGIAVTKQGATPCWGIGGAGVMSRECADCYLERGSAKTIATVRASPSSRRMVFSESDESYIAVTRTVASALSPSFTREQVSSSSDVSRPLDVAVIYREVRFLLLGFL